MLNKSDLKAIKQIVQDVALTKDDAKSFATKDDLKLELNPLKQDVQNIKKDVTYLKKDVTDMKKDITFMKKDITDIKAKVNEFASFTINAVGNILDWTQDIHNSIIKEKLPKRVKKLEQILRTS